jgi:dienelactone hydrolase
MIRIVAAAVSAALLFPLAGTANGQTVSDLSSRPGVTVRLLKYEPANPIGAVVLLAGGNGRLDIANNGAILLLGEDSLIRNRDRFAAAGFAVAVPDLASDLKRGAGVVEEYRWSAQHAQDLGAISALMQTHGKVYLIAASQAALSAANAAARLQGPLRPQGVIIAGGHLLEKDGKRPSVQRYIGNLRGISAPVLLLGHEEDRCAYSPPQDLGEFRALLPGAMRVDLKYLSGGASRGDPCEARAYHGFNGIDEAMVKAMVEWLKSLPR